MSLDIITLGLAKSYTDEHGGGGGQVQPDLSQTDTAKPDYVKGVIRQESLPEGYPYKEGVTIEWDGNTKGLADYGGFYRISDKIVPYASFANAQVWYTNNGSDKRIVKVTASDMTSNGIPVYTLRNMDRVPMIYCVYEDYSNESVTMPAGMYFYYSNANNYVSEFSSETIHTMAPEFIPSSVTAIIKNAATKENPVFTGSFSQNRKENTVIGIRSHTEGFRTTASGDQSHAESYETTASGNNSHAEGFRTTASGQASHAEGSICTASEQFSHAEGLSCTASGQASHAEGDSCTASGQASHAEGYYCTASGQYSHAEGYYCTAQGKNQRVQGKFNIASGTSDSIVDSDYSHIVGNGTNSSAPSNAHTLTWSGVPWYQGRPQFGGTAMDNGSQTVMANGDKEIILASSTANSIKKFKITVDDSGTLTATEITG